MISRYLNIVARTIHIAAMAVLLGGHAFDVPAERLHVALWITVGSGVLLIALEAGTHLLWFHQVRGLMTLGKLGVICLVPLLWDYRFVLLMVVVVIASVGSHMPARFRYYSVLTGQIVRDPSGPGGGS